MTVVRRCLLPLSVLIAATSTPVAAQCSPVGLSPGAPQTVFCTPTTFTVSAVPGHWNAVGVSSVSDWNMTLIPAISTVPGTDFVMANGHIDAPSVSSGVVNRASGSGQAAVAHVTANPLSLEVPVSDTLPASSPIHLYEFQVLILGNYTINVGSPGGVGWAVFDPGPNANWRPRTSSYVAASGGSATVAMGPGWYAIAVFRTTYPGSAIPLNVSVTCGLSPIYPAANATISISQPCQYFEPSPSPGRWNAVGITSASNWNVTVGGATSGNSALDAVVANGHVGAVSGGPATFNRQSGSASAWAVHAVNSTPLTLGTATTSTWSTTTVLQVFEFEIQQTEQYDVSVTGPSNLRFALELPGSSPDWRPCSAPFSVPGGLGNYTLDPGWHALLVGASGGVGVSGTVTARVGLTPSPVPSVSGLSPESVPAGGPAFTLDILGYGFFEQSEVRWAGQVLPSTLVNPNLLRIQVPASLISDLAEVTVDVVNPPPAGGTSGRVFRAVPPLITGLNPNALGVPMPPGSQGVEVYVDRGGAFSSVYANGVLVPSVWNPLCCGIGTLGSLLSSTVPGTQVPGALAITVVNYGRFQSNTVALKIGSGENAGFVLTDPLTPAPGSPFSLKIEGGEAWQPFTLVASSPPAAPVALAGTPFILGIDFASIIPVIDGLGVFGPPAPVALSPPPVYSAATGGNFTISGLTMPSPPLGFDVVLQAAWWSSSPAGFVLTWTRHPLSL